jgi:peroxiredoxin
MRLEQGRIYVALVEAFAVRAWAQQPSVIDEVNLAYDQSIRIAELTIGGYDLLVGAPAPAR